MYHLMSRGNDGQSIFISDADRELFLATVGEMSERFEVDIFAYVLMSNHLLLKTGQVPIATVMRRAYDRVCDHFQQTAPALGTTLLRRIKDFFKIDTNPSCAMKIVIYWSWCAIFT